MGHCHRCCQDSAQHPGVERSSHSPPQWGHCTGPASGPLGLLAVSLNVRLRAIRVVVLRTQDGSWLPKAFPMQ